MDNIIYIKSLHRPYNQNLNSVKWVCKFIKRNNSENEIVKSDFYVEFYIFLLKKLYISYSKSSNGLIAHGIPSYESVNNAHLFLDGFTKIKKKQVIIDSLSRRQNDVEKSIYSTYKAASYFINLAKDKLDFIDTNNNLNENGNKLIGLKSNDFRLSQKEKEMLFVSILRTDFHFFISLVLLQKIQKKIKNLSIEEIHINFLVDRFNLKHFKYTEASNEKNYSKVREHWLKDLSVLDKNFNIKKVFLFLIFENDFENEFKFVESQVAIYYRENLVSRSKYQKLVELFIVIYITTLKNELGFIPLQELAIKMKLSKNSFQKFLSEFYESEKYRYNIFFNNIVQSYSHKNQYLIRNRPVVNIKIKELNKN